VRRGNPVCNAATIGDTIADVIDFRIHGLRLLNQLPG
jgi:hypothetical protein